MNKEILGESQTRYAWIDLAKFICITLVVFFHCPPPLTGIAGVSLGRFRIPLFFFLSGLLFKFEKHPSFIGFFKYRSRQLLIPYFVFFLLFYTFWVFAGRKIGNTEELSAPVYEPLLEYLYGRPKMVCMPLWFISCLFLMQCFFYLFKRLNKILSLSILFLLPWVPELIDMSNAPWMLDNVFLNIPFYGAAVLFKKEFFQLLYGRKQYLQGVLMLCIHFIIVSLLNAKMIGNDYLLIALRMLAGICIIFPCIVLIKMVSERWKMNRWIKYISVNTIIVLAFHTYVIRIFEITVFNILHLSGDFFEGKYLLKLLMSVFIMPVMTIPIYLINKYTPFILGRGRLFDRQKQ